MKKLLETFQIQLKEIAPAIGITLTIVVFAVLAANVLYQEKIILKRGFEIEISADGSVAKKEEKLVSLSELMKLADVTRGAKIFKKCASCHNAEKGAAAKVGPNLYGVINRARGSFSGFSYSKAMKEKGGSWDRESVDQFITKPKEYLPGTKMAFAGLKKPQDRADVILFLEQNK
jgi:cytochrome c